MELANRDVLELIFDSSRKARVAVQARSAVSIQQPKRQRRQPDARCRCGVCRSCLDNARWEKIFREKFADPGYYRFRAPSPASSLHL
jgi:hypothetical protein